MLIIFLVKLEFDLHVWISFGL